MDHYEATTSPLVHEGKPTLFFYGGPYSNFVGGPFLISTERAAFARPWGIDLMSYKSVEHFFQAMKATNFEDHEAVRNAATPGLAKKIGRKITLRADWEHVKYEVMLVGLRAKFAERVYKQVMIGDRNLMLAEDSPTDFVWGIRDADGGFTGENLLGKALMEVRVPILETVAE